MQEAKETPDQEPYPVMRIRISKDMAVYPKMVPDGKGGWKLKNPAYVGRLLNEAGRDQDLQE